MCLLSFSAALACTDVVVGRDASVDGSVMTCHTADGAYYDAQIRFIPGQKYPAGTNMDVYRNIVGEEPGGWASLKPESFLEIYTAYAGK